MTCVNDKNALVSLFQEVINHFAQVRELAKKMLHENHYASKDLKTQKEFLDRGCRAFAMRMNRRRDVILASLKFHKGAGDVSRGFSVHEIGPP